MDTYDFNSGASEICPDEANMECTIYVDLDGWDSVRTAIHHIEAFAEGDNDMMGEEIEERLNKMGVALIYPGEVNDDGDIVEFKLKEIK